MLNTMDTDDDFEMVVDPFEIDDIEETNNDVIDQVNTDEMTTTDPPPAFLLPKVLTTLFNVCDPKDLKNLRLVCRSWFQNSLNSFREKTNVNIQNGRCEFGDTPHKVDFLTLLPLLNDPLDPLHFKQRPIQNVVLRDCLINKWALAGFWTATSPWLQSVELFDNACFNEIDSVLDMLSQCPNLQRLKVWLHMMPSWDYEFVYDAAQGQRPRDLPVYSIDQLQKNDHLTDFHMTVVCYCTQPTQQQQQHQPRATCTHHVPWTNVFGRYPNLKKLKIGSDLLNPNPVLEEIFDGIKSVRESSPMTMEISELEFEVTRPLNFIYSDSLISKICSANLPLKVIKANFECTSVPLITNLIQCHERTLTSIKCKFSKNSTPAEDDLLFQSFPPGLRQLTLYENKPLSSLRFLQHVTNLNVLEYVPVKKKKVSLVGQARKDHVEFYTDSLRGINFRWEMVNELIMPGTYFTGRLLLQLTGCMPNIVKLTIALCDETLGVVYSHWGNLTRLTFVGVGVTEDGIVGRDDEGVEPRGIARLRSLSYLDMEKVTLNERCVREGFLKLPYLKTLRMRGCEMTWEEDTKAALAAHTAVVVVGIEQEQQSGEQYQQQQQQQQLGTFGFAFGTRT